MKDIILDDNGNITQNGVLVIDDARQQTVEHLVEAFTGEYKHAPQLGGNGKGMIAGEVDPFWQGEIKAQLKQCLLDVENVSVSTEGVEIGLKN